jgi:hypothetical protein
VSQAGADRAGDQGVGQFAEDRRQPFGHHFPVAVHAQLARQPLQFIADRVGDRAVEDLAVGAEGAAQPAGGDAHAVDRVVRVLPYGGVEFEDRVALGTDVGEDVVAGGDRSRGLLGHGRRLALLLRPRISRRRLSRPRLSRPRLSRPRLSRFRRASRLRQRPRQLRRGRRRPYARLAQPFLHLVEEVRVAVVGEFDLDLGPLDGAAAVGQALRAYGVHADLGEQRAVRVHEVPYVAVGAQPDQGPQLGLADAGADQGGEAVRHGVGERFPDLVADAGRDRHLQVPARVGTAGAAAQGECGGGEAFVGGVVVHGVQMRDALVDDGLHPGDAGQVGQTALVGLVLTLDLALCVRHDLNLVARRSERQGASPMNPRETRVNMQVAPRATAAVRRTWGAAPGSTATAPPRATPRTSTFRRTTRRAGAGR